MRGKVSSLEIVEVNHLFPDGKYRPHPKPLDDLHGFHGPGGGLCGEGDEEAEFVVISLLALQVTNKETSCFPSWEAGRF